VGIDDLNEMFDTEIEPRTSTASAASS